MKILQLGKFYPVLGGVEKVMFDLTVGLSETGLSEVGLSEVGLSEEGVECDMMCAASDGRRRRGTEVIRLNPHGRILCHRTLIEAAKTTIAPSMVTRLRRIAKDYDIIHIHHPDPMAAMALRLSGYKGKVVLHWHSDILSQKALLRFYLPTQNWLIKRADTIVGTTPVYLAESPYLQGVQEKCRCIPIGIEPVISDSAREQEIRNEYSGRRIIFSLGRLVEYKGYRYLIEAAKYLDDSFMILIGGGGPLRESLQREIDELGVGSRVKLLGKWRIPNEKELYFIPMYCGEEITGNLAGYKPSGTETETGTMRYAAKTKYERPEGSHVEYMIYYLQKDGNSGTPIITTGHGQSDADFTIRCVRDAPQGTRSYDSSYSSGGTGFGL